jgi:hypothetical protein
MKSRTTSRTRPAVNHSATRDSAREHFHREKARRAGDKTPESDAMAAARREYLAQLEAAAAKGKGGRPKKKPARPAEAEDAVSEDDAGE